MWQGFDGNSAVLSANCMKEPEVSPRLLSRISGSTQALRLKHSKSYALSLLHFLLSDSRLSEEVICLFWATFLCKESKEGNSDEFFLPLLFHWLSILAASRCEYKRQQRRNVILVALEYVIYVILMFLNAEIQRLTVLLRIIFLLCFPQSIKVNSAIIEPTFK
jgi:hypothetical protein